MSDDDEIGERLLNDPRTFAILQIGKKFEYARISENGNTGHRGVLEFKTADAAAALWKRFESRKAPNTFSARTCADCKTDVGRITGICDCCRQKIYYDGEHIGKGEGIQEATDKLAQIMTESKPVRNEAFLKQLRRDIEYCRETAKKHKYAHIANDLRFEASVLLQIESRYLSTHGGAAANENGMQGVHNSPRQPGTVAETTSTPAKAASPNICGFCHGNYLWKEFIGRICACQNCDDLIAYEAFPTTLVYTERTLQKLADWLGRRTGNVPYSRWLDTAKKAGMSEKEAKKAASVLCEMDMNDARACLQSCGLIPIPRIIEIPCYACKGTYLNIDGKNYHLLVDDKCPYRSNSENR